MRPRRTASREGEARRDTDAPHTARSRAAVLRRVLPRRPSMSSGGERSDAPIVFVAGPGDPRDRLDKLVVALLARAGVVESRAVVQRWIEHGRVLVDGSPARASAAVAAGARVEVSPEPPPPSAAEQDPSIQVRVVFE